MTAAHLAAHDWAEVAPGRWIAPGVGECALHVALDMLLREKHG